MENTAPNFKSQNLYVTLSPVLYEAINAFLRHRKGGDEPTFYQRAAFFREMLKQFMAVAPYERDGFFWVKRNAVKGDPKMGVSYNGHESDEYLPIQALMDRDELVSRLGILMDYNQISEGKKLSKTLLGYTVMLWAIATQLDEVEKQIPEVLLFMEYANRHYTHPKSGKNALNVYIEDYQRFFWSCQQNQSQEPEKSKAQPVETQLSQSDVEDFLKYALIPNDQGNESATGDIHAENSESAPHSVRLGLSDLSVQNAGNDLQVAFKIKKSDLMDWVKRFMVFAQASDLHDFID